MDLERKSWNWINIQNKQTNKFKTNNVREVVLGACVDEQFQKIRSHSGQSDKYARQNANKECRQPRGTCELNSNDLKTSEKWHKTIRKMQRQSIIPLSASIDWIQVITDAWRLCCHGEPPARLKLGEFMSITSDWPNKVDHGSVDGPDEKESSRVDDDDAADDDEVKCDDNDWGRAKGGDGFVAIERTKIRQASDWQRSLRRWIWPSLFAKFFADANRPLRLDFAYCLLLLDSTLSSGWISIGVNSADSTVSDSLSESWIMERLPPPMKSNRINASMAESGDEGIADEADESRSFNKLVCTNLNSGVNETNQPGNWTPIFNAFAADRGKKIL